MLKQVCESLQSTYSPHFLPVEPFFFWSVYGVFEQQRLISVFDDVQEALFFALGSWYVLMCPCTPKWDRNILSNSVDPKSDCAHRKFMIKVCIV